MKLDLVTSSLFWFIFVIIFGILYGYTYNLSCVFLEYLCLGLQFGFLISGILIHLNMVKTC